MIEGKMQIRRVVFRAAQCVVCEKKEEQYALKADEVLIENRYTLISPGTERSYLAHGKPTEAGKSTWPIYPGYAAVGRVIERGGDVRAYAVGDVVYTNQPHASHTVVQETGMIRKVPDGTPWEHVPFVTLAWVGLTAVVVSGLRMGDTVAVIGQGLVGNLSAQLCRLAGARRVLAVEPSTHRRAVSQACGLTYGINPDQADWVESIRSMTNGRMCGIVVETSGVASVIRQALKIVAPFGKVVLLGSSFGQTVELDMYKDVHLTGVSILGAHSNCLNNTPWPAFPDSRTLMLEFIAERRLIIPPLITAICPASQAAEAYKRFDTEKDRVLGMALDWQA